MLLAITSFPLSTVSAQKQTLKGVTDYITNIICKRADAGYNYGIILIPEGLIDFILELLIELDSADQCKGVYIIGATNRPEVMDQAAAHGLPMVATKNGGPVDIHRVLDNGLLVDPHDQQSVADALLKLVADNFGQDAGQTG